MRNFLIIYVLVVVGPFVGGASADPIPRLVEVWKGGDDGFTNRLSDAIENAFKASSDFRLSSGKLPGTMLAIIPSNVGWEKVGNRTNVKYTVEFKTVDARNLGAYTGSCWDDTLRVCTNQIVNDARIAAGKISAEESSARSGENQKTTRKEESCQYWQSLVDPTVRRPSISLMPDQNDPAIVQDAIECLLELQGKRNLGSFSGATRLDVSDVFDPATVEVGALYYVSYLFTGKRDFTYAIALRGSDGKFNSPLSVTIAYKKYRAWYKKVQKLGVSNAREMKLDPLQGSKVRWY